MSLFRPRPSDYFGCPPECIDDPNCDHLPVRPAPQPRLIDNNPEKELNLGLMALLGLALFGVCVLALGAYALFGGWSQ